MEDTILTTVHALLEFDPLRFASESFEDDLANEVYDSCVDVLAALDEWDPGMEEDLRRFVISCIGYYFLSFPGAFAPRSEHYFLSADGEKAAGTEKTRAKILDFLEKHENNQKTAEWLTKRHEMFTAAVIHKLFGSAAKQNQLLYEKGQPLALYSGDAYAPSVWRYAPREHGNKYEPLSKKRYEALKGTVVHEFGCIPHPLHPFIGASPDGISDEGKMLEIKNPISRDITGVISEEYWIQMQIQMEVCDLEECDFYETKFQEFPDEESFVRSAVSETAAHGAVLHLVHTRQFEASLSRVIQVLKEDDKTDAAPFQKYVYMDAIECPVESEELGKKKNDWVDEARQKHPEYHIHDISFWVLKNESCIAVKRNRAWFAAALPIIAAAWKVVEEERVSGAWAARAPKRKEIRCVVGTNEKEIELPCGRKRKSEDAEDACIKI